MRFFSKMKLSGKIISMVLVLMVLLLVVSAVSILKMQNIGREINEVSKELIPLTELVTGIEMYQLEQEVVYERALRYANIKEDSGLEDIREEFTNYSRLVGKEVAEAEKIAKYMIVEAGTDAELKEHREVYEQIQRIKGQHAAYERHVMDVFQAIAQGDKSNTEAVSAGLKAEEEALGNEIKEFLAVVERFTEEAAVAAERDEHSALIIIISVALFSMLFGSLIATAAIRSILKQLGGDPIVITALAERIAEGDVSMGNESGKRYFEGIMRSMIDMSGKLIKIVGQISGYSTFVAASSDELTALSGKIAGGVEEQSQQIEQAATAASEVSQTIADVARNASEATNAANESLAAANEGKTIVEQTVVSMMNISGTVDMSSKQMEALGESSQHIGEIIDVISDIAGQTNLLALNAAIEAARAGDQGRGFAVVADEVKKLAEKTTAATEEITRMVTKIQSDTGESVKSMEKNKLEAETGVKLAERSTEALEKIVESSRTSLDMMNSIATATEQQSSAVEEVSTGMESIASAFADSRDALTHINSSTNELSLIAQDLMAIVSWFKMESIANEWNGYKQINNSIKENNGNAVAATLQ